MIGSTAEAQNAFHSDITTYINGGVFSHSDLYFSVFSPWLPFIKHAKALIQKYERLLIEIPIGSGPKLNIPIEPYKGENPHVLKMMAYLEKHLKDDIVGAYIHGSLGTYEEIAYSDFDALIILKNEVFQSPKRLVTAARKLNAARSIMFDYDPLQHHGWFVLTEADLKSYCNAYFPIELFNYSRSLFRDRGLKLEIALRESSSESRMTFEKMCGAIVRKIENRQYPRNVYQLKGVLSQFMLLPALYLQAKNGCGIYKKESFDLARVNFDSANWTIMDKVSEIRTNWNYEISAFKRWMMSHTHFLSRYFAKNFAPAIPEKIGCVLSAEFYVRMKKLASLMKEMQA